MAQVDPFIQPIPKKILQDPEVRDYFQYLHRFLHDLWVRTGGGDDQINNLGVRELYPYQSTEEATSTDLTNLYSVGVSDSSKKEYYSVSSNHTTTGNEIIEATAELSVTLNTTPELLEAVSVKRNGTGIVTIVGTIDGDSNFQLLYNDESVDLIYNGSGWLII